MIRRTFQLLSGIGPWREKDLWARGIQFWDDFPAAGGAVGISAVVDELARKRIDEGRAALAARDLRTLGKLVRPREHWRLFGEFESEGLFLDVEAEGRQAHTPSVVGVYDRGGLGVFVRGRNLQELPDRLSASRFWITFNGSCFDLPILKGFFGALPEPSLHLDLHFLCRRLGIAGGLKED